MVKCCPFLLHHVRRPGQAEQKACPEAGWAGKCVADAEGLGNDHEAGSTGTAPTRGLLSLCAGSWL